MRAIWLLAAMVAVGGCHSGPTGSSGGSSNQGTIGGQGVGSSSGGGSSSGDTDPNAVGHWVTPAFGAESQAFLDLLAQAKNGQPVDLFGTGVPSYTSTVSDAGVLTVTLDLNGDGNPEYFFTWDPTTQTGSQVADADSDGVPNYSATLTANPPTVTANIASSGTGPWDTQRTDVYSVDGGTHRILIEVLADGGTWPDGGDPEDAGWVVLTDTTQPLGVNGLDANGFYECDPPSPGRPADPLAPNGVACDAFSGTSAFPAQVPPAQGSSTFNVFGNGGAANGSDGSCSQANTAKLSTALDCAVKQARSCVGSNNAQIAGSMAVTLEFGGWSLACGDQCPGGAQTDDDQPACAFVVDPYFPTYACVPRRTNMSPTSVANATPEALCEALLHELMHVASVPSPDNATHDRCRNDPVYACSRYCAGCSTATSLPGMTSNADCAVCADTPAKRLACGQKVTYQTGLCAFSQQNLYGCDSPPGADSCPIGWCEDCGIVSTFTCEGGLASISAPNPQATCCSSCAGGAGCVITNGECGPANATGVMDGCNSYAAQCPITP